MKPTATELQAALQGSRKRKGKPADARWLRHLLAVALRGAISDPSAADRASKALADLATHTMRRLLTSYAAFNPNAPRRRR
jgi:hypothetical protein